ncbi:hypothetical protein BDV24DRAFT_155890 [Aspergillus arachidicola]|uniref:Nucleoside phosphorylase domain-containing protein n=1 Tax=Aspergillus arachidicola TaxID=656916 RepID=A0A5N6XRM5_9EURO|nr:hypothetical protein BDV24DRAFT_155890 [Aspergillus arachidicola]
MAAQADTKSKSHSEYTVGWICTLLKEQTAATSMLDQRHPGLPQPSNDPNTYTLGSIGKHNIVITCLPKGRYGANSAATVAMQMVRTFPSIKVGLMVGIGGGIPPKFPGVVQWDMGKTKDGSFERTGALNNPPTSLLTTLTKLETEHDLYGTKIPESLKELKQKWPKLAPTYLKCDSFEDPLHTHDQSQPGDVRVHYGLIASGNRVINDATFRDKLDRQFGGHVLCVETEANNEWQEYAATVAAAFAKELLEYVKPTDVDEERPVKDFLDQILDTVSRNGADIKVMRSKLARKEDQGILDWLTPINYGLKQSDIFRRQQPGTEWLNTSHQTLFCSVVNNLINSLSQDSTVGIAYICCNFQRKDEQNIDHLLASLLKQLTESCFSLPESVRDLFNHNKVQRARPSLEDISRALHSVVAKYSRTFVVVDALDECQTSEGCRMKFLSELSSPQAKNGVNIFATSRVDDEIGKTLTKAIYLKVYARDDDIEMFLLAELHMNSLLSLPTRGHVKDALQNLTKGIEKLDEIYEQAMIRIEDHGKESRDLAKQILSWIHALAVRPHTTELDKDYIPNINILQSLCVGLVTIDEENDTIRLVHYTAQEYFQRTQQRWFLGGESEITRSCVTYLSYSAFQRGTPLLLAAENRYEAMVRLLLVTSILSDRVVDQDQVYHYGSTLFSIVVRASHAEVVKVLLDTAIVA